MDSLNVTRSKFEDLLAGEKPVLVDFWASWCGPCRMMAPIVEEIAAEHAELAVAKVNVDDEPELAQKYKVMNIPTLLLFRGGDIVKRQIGAVSKSRLEEMLKDL
ncbi:MAG: thioredoxin [Lachnospiraceae bacterium]|nr:thioredoxin [Lachnospiraceae bacterium]